MGEHLTEARDIRAADSLYPRGAPAGRDEWDYVCETKFFFKKKNETKYNF